jgi:molybdate transport system substrate-binding protein
MSTRSILPAFLLLLLAMAPAARGAEVRVAVAANFSEPMKKIAGEFEKTSGHKAVLISGATGRFYAQIKAGAPFDVLLAADDETPAKLVQEANALPASRFTYAIGRLVLWSASETTVDTEGSVLKRNAFDRLAIANPRLAPYGSAAMETLKSLGLHDTLAAKIVQGENIAQTYQFVASGNAALGFVALSQVITADGRVESGSMWIVPDTHYSQIRQDAVLLEHGRNNLAAQALLQYLKGDFARSVIAASGYRLDR